MKILSGGQTGVDRAALDAAIDANLPHGGWCPAGRIAEDGIIPIKYELSETNSSDYAVRTEANIMDSDASLICVWKNAPGKGTKLTQILCRKYKKLHVQLELNHPEFKNILLKWVSENDIKTLNVAGNRESQSPGIHQFAYEKFVSFFSEMRQ
ncbi:MAG: putative molybdenum carrier protein [Bacteroidales bacterium]|jgi:hypothetical protein|nr:putative molybdenum carrier protein [Bacteroidales bacterium]